MSTLFWNSITKSNDDFTNILEEHKNKSKISMTVSYIQNNNTTFFDDKQSENEGEFYESPEVYEDILDEYEWSVSLQDHTNSISMRIDNYFNSRYNNNLTKYLYDKEENIWFTNNYADHHAEEDEEYEEIIA